MLYAVSLRPTLTLSPAGESRSHRICKKEASQSASRDILSIATADVSPAKNIFGFQCWVDYYKGQGNGSGEISESMLSMIYDTAFVSLSSFMIKTCAT